jgi:hypothetical protein
MAESVENDLRNEANKNQQLKEKLENFKNVEEDTEKRSELEQQIKELLEVKKKLLLELENYKQNDPELVNKMKESIIISKKSCNRWIENIFNLKSWLKNKYQVEEKVLDSQFEIPDDLDYIN